MEKLIIEASIDTPTVLMDAEKGYFEISGKSYPEDTLEFYTPVLNWMNSYSQKPQSISTFAFKLVYFNSSSYKPILDLILMLEELKQNNCEVKIEWHYKTGDTDLKEAGEEFADIITIPFDYYTF
jgi:hypothetical protein